jgi:hypothetical protein
VSAETEALISTVAAAVAAVAALFALGVAVVALVVARRTLKEARETTAAQRETLGATETLVRHTEALTTRIEASTRALHLILSEAQASRELEQLRRIADQVGVVTVARRGIREASAQHNPPPWFEHQDASNVLAANLEGLPPDALPKCRVLAGVDPRLQDSAGDQAAAEEIKQAIAAARIRLADLAAKATAETRTQGGA